MPNKKSEAKVETEVKEQPEVVKEIHHYHDRRPFNFGALFAGLILITLGIAYLLNSLGVANINWNINWNLVWPVVLILIGLSILSRRGWVSALIGGIVTIGVIIIIVAALFGGFNQNVTQVQNQPVIIEKIANVNSANVVIKTGAIKVKINGGGTKLIDGNLSSNFLKLEQNSVLNETSQAIELKTVGSANGVLNSGNNKLDLILASDMPINLTIESGASTLDLDLRDVMITNLTIKTGASTSNIKFGEKVAHPIYSASAGASTFNVSFPKSFGGQAIIKSGLSSKNLPSFTQVSDGLYKTANYDTTENKIEMNFDIGVSTLNITQ